MLVKAYGIHQQHFRSYSAFSRSNGRKRKIEEFKNSSQDFVSFAIGQVKKEPGKQVQIPPTFYQSKKEDEIAQKMNILIDQVKKTGKEQTQNALELLFDELEQSKEFNNPQFRDLFMQALEKGHLDKDFTQTVIEELFGYSFELALEIVEKCEF